MTDAFKPLTEADDHLLKNCLKNNPMQGSISIAFETEPAYFRAIGVQGKHPHIAGEITADRRLKGFGVRSVKNVFVNGNTKDVGYLSGLRINPEFRNTRFIFKIYDYLKKLNDTDEFPFYLTTIIEDNYSARKLLESGAGSLPNYIPFDTLSTFVIKPAKRKHHYCCDIVKGDAFSVDELFDFLNHEGKHKQFFPCYNPSDLDTPLLRGLQQQDFYVAVDGSKMLGMIAKWDQQDFKQNRVAGYDRKTSLARPFLNLASGVTGMPVLPRPGELIHSFYASFPVVNNNDTVVLQDLLAAIKTDPANREYNYFMIGLAHSDPLMEAAKPFQAIAYRSVIYLVSFHKTRRDVEGLKDRPAFLEIATL